MRKPRVWLACLLCLVMAVATGAFSAWELRILIQLRQLQNRQWMAEAVLDSKDQQYHSRGGTAFRVHYHFEVAGRRYDGGSEVSSRYKDRWESAQTPLRVSYLRSNPAVNHWEPGLQEAITTALLVSLFTGGIALINVAGLIGIWRNSCRRAGATGPEPPSGPIICRD